MATQYNDLVLDLIAMGLAADGKLQQMPPEWHKLLFENPVEDWPPEMLAIVRDYLPKKSRDEDNEE